MIPQEIFFSHSSADRAFSDQLASTLQRHGIPVWYSPTNVVGAQQWQDEIGSALKRCDWFVLILSENAVQSLWVKRELSYALQQHRYVNRITPVVLRTCDHEQLSWTLSALQFVSFTNGFELGCRDLLRVWGLGYKAT